jgi:predicted TIM-barrel fold metal-dependent hydrolase
LLVGDATLTIPQCAPARPITRAPSFVLPAGAIDCHFHIFGPSPLYPYAPGRSYTPPDAPLAAYEHLADTLGFSRAVIVQPSVYGLDNSRTLAAVEESRLPMRAVVVLDPAVSEAELEDLHRRGVRGVRINLLFKAGLALDATSVIADKVRDLGWHLQFLADISQVTNLSDLVGRLRVPVVFDHLGHLPAGKGIVDPGFRDLLALLRDEKAWVKLSGTYRVTGRDRVPYDDAAPFVQALVEANPRHLVWGTDWPHPSIGVPMPDDTDLLEMFCGWVPDESLRRLIFVDNPERLYGFEAI